MLTLVLLKNWRKILEIFVHNDRCATFHSLIIIVQTAQAGSLHQPITANSEWVWVDGSFNSTKESCGLSRSDENRSDLHNVGERQGPHVEYQHGELYGRLVDLQIFFCVLQCRQISCRTTSYTSSYNITTNIFSLFA